MPITGRTARECFETFGKHMSGLVAATVTTQPLMVLHEHERTTLSFRAGSRVATPIDTRHGQLYFYLGQALEAVEENRLFRLKTRAYWYRLQHSPEAKSKAVIRWEYDSTTATHRHARHHAQLDATVTLGDSALEFNKAHLPTGWVTIEEVIRFLIVDLGMQPLCGAGWPNVLAESERLFFEKFTGKRWRPRGVEEGIG